jgi:transposase
METVNNEIVWRSDNSKVSPGFLIESLVISTLSNRKPLWKMHEFWTQAELDYYYKDLDLRVELLNDDAYGRALDKLGKVKMQDLVGKICLEMLKLHELDLTHAHFDTTSKSVQGVFKEEVDGEFDIVLGFSKDHRHDLKQYKIGAAVQQNGLPVMGELLAGNKVDSQWNADSICKMRGMFEGHGFENTIFIGDSATVASYESLKKLEHMKFISRFPETFSLTKKLKEEAYLADSFEDIKVTGEEKVKYKISTATRMLNEIPYRFIVVHSTALKARKTITQEKNIQKEQKKLEKNAKNLYKMAYACEADALSALEKFKETVTAKGFLISCEVEVKSKAVYSKRGRPKNSDIVKEEETFHVVAAIIGPNKDVFEKKLEMGSTFVLITSILDNEELSDAKILSEYKQQNSIEQAFKFLKNPVYLGQTLLNRKNRVEAMGYVFILVLMIACYLQYRVRKSLEDKNEYVLDPGNKKNYRPSTKRIFEILENVVVLITPYGRFFPSNTNPRIFKMIEWAGFDPEIYLKI